MNVTEILELDRQPFLTDILYDDMQDATAMYINTAHLVRMHLYLEYYQRFCEKIGIRCDIPQSWLFINKKARYYYMNHYESYQEQKENMNAELFKNIMGWSSWDYGKMELDEEEQFESAQEVEACITDWAGDCNQMKTCSNTEWRDMALAIPELYIDSSETLNYIVVYICWNKKLASYLHYRKCNMDVVKTTFLVGDLEIMRILQTINDPFQNATGLHYTELMPERYLLGFFSGSNDEYSVGFCNLHMHFGLNIIVLELLLDAAVQTFGLQGDCI